MYIVEQDTHFLRLESTVEVINFRLSAQKSPVVFLAAENLRSLVSSRPGNLASTRDRFGSQRQMMINRIYSRMQAVLMASRLPTRNPSNPVFPLFPSGMC